MDTLQMYEIVNRLPHLKPHFQGIFATDTPDQVTRFPSAIVCNTDPAEKPGAHWIAFWFKNRYECEFYDSFGRRPEEYGDALRTFIDKHSTMCLYNNVQVQPYSAVTCGFPSDDFVRMFVLKNMI